MNFVDLQVFKSVVDEGGVISAASKLHRVPSAVTTRIKQLEASMGVKLFHRDRQRLHLSPAGELLLGLCRAADPAFRRSARCRVRDDAARRAQAGRAGEHDGKPAAANPRRLSRPLPGRTVGA